VRERERVWVRVRDRVRVSERERERVRVRVRDRVRVSDRARESVGESKGQSEGE
jgi:hypothetical protein